MWPWASHCAQYNPGLSQLGAFYTAQFEPGLQAHDAAVLLKKPPTAIWQGVLPTQAASVPVGVTAHKALLRSYVRPRPNKPKTQS